MCNRKGIIMSGAGGNHTDPVLRIVTCSTQSVLLNFSETLFLNLKNDDNKPFLRFAVIVKQNNVYKVYNKLRGMH